MGADTSHKFSFIDPPADFDPAYFFFQLRRQSPSARCYLNEDGRDSGNEGSWDTLVPDLQKVTSGFPNLLVEVREKIVYEDTEEVRYRFRDGQYQMIEPILTWPEFSEDNWNA